MRRLIAAAAVLIAAGSFTLIAAGSSSGPSGTTYKIELDNAFGLVAGSQFKVAGVPAGSISSLTVDPRTLNALATVDITQPGL
jgi:ABC-type transporter Mla subunit MlaD